jgi:hypothetical protein
MVNDPMAEALGAFLEYDWDPKVQLAAADLVGMNSFFLLNKIAFAVAGVVHRLTDVLMAPPAPPPASLLQLDLKETAARALAGLVAPMTPPRPPPLEADDPMTIPQAAAAAHALATSMAGRFSERSLNVHRMFPECALNVP